MRPKKKERKENTLDKHDENSSDESDNQSLISAASRSSRRSTRSIGSRRSGTPLSITLRSHCKQHGSTCTEGHGLEFHNRISPSPKRRSPTRHSRGSPDSLPAQIVSKNEQNGRNSSLAKKVLDMSLKDSIETSAQRRVLRSRTVDISQASNVTVDESLQQFLKEQRAAAKDVTITAAATTTTSQAMMERFMITNSEDLVTKVSEQHYTSSSRTHKTSDYSSDEEIRKLASNATRAALLPPSANANTVAEAHGMTQRVFDTISNVGNQFLSTVKTSASQMSTSAYPSAAAIYSSDEDDSTVQKTDYTYAHSLSYRPKVTPDRVITPPNMSRRSIKEQTIFEHYTSPVLAMAGMDVDPDSTFGMLTRRRGSPPRKVVFPTREEGSNGSSSGNGNRYVRLRYGLDGPSEEEDSEEEGDEGDYALVRPEQLPQSRKIAFQTRKITRSVVGTIVNSFLWVWNWLYLAICYWMLLDTWVLMKGAHVRQRLAPYKKWAICFLLLPILLAAGGLLWGSVSIAHTSEFEEPSAEKSSFVTLASSCLISWGKSASVSLAYYPWIWIQSLIDLNSQVWSYLWNGLSNIWQSPAVLNASILSTVVPSSGEGSSAKTQPKSAPENSATSETLKVLPVALLQNDNVLSFLTTLSKNPLSASQPTQELNALLDKLTQQLAKTREDHEALAGKWRDLTEWQEKLKMEQDGQRLQGHADKSGLEGEIAALKAQLDASLAQLEALKAQVTPCCSSDSVTSDLMDQKVAALIHAMMGRDATADVDLTKFGAWFRSRLAVRKEHQADLNATLENWRQEVKGFSSKFQAEKQELVDMIRAQVEEKLDAFMALQISRVKTTNFSQPLEPFGNSGLSTTDVEAIVRVHLRRYDADKTGMADYALESAGASIQSTRCTEDYKQNKAVLSVFGINLWHKSNSPSIALVPDMAPGKCWSFKGAQGYLLIRLAAAIRPTAFTMEHISRNVSLTGRIDSAPKKFSVWGFKSEQDPDSVLLGRYVYDEWGEPLQTFLVQHEDPDVFPMVQLNVESNHGNINFTCLYRFRVHGLLPRVH